VALVALASAVFGFGAAAGAALYFWLGLLGGWFFLLPLVERVAGTRIAIACAIATGIAFAGMKLFGALPKMDAIEESAAPAATRRI